MDSVSDSERTEKDFRKFSPNVYLKEYYSEVQEEDHFFFLHVEGGRIFVPPPPLTHVRRMSARVNIIYY
jgi:hypothetical protein